MSTLVFDGSDYNHDRDGKRLSSQFLDIFNLMSDGQYRSLKTISDKTGHPESSVSAQLRHMRKLRFGGHKVNKTYIGDGLYLYQLIVNEH